jgi:hypothetical protein
MQLVHIDTTHDPFAGHNLMSEGPRTRNRPENPSDYFLNVGKLIFPWGRHNETTSNIDENIFRLFIWISSLISQIILHNQSSKIVTENTV